VLGAVVGPDRSNDEWWAADEQLAPNNAGVAARYRERLEIAPPGSLLIGRKRRDFRGSAGD
jgi:hypothetical protein